MSVLAVLQSFIKIIGIILIWIFAFAKSDAVFYGRVDGFSSFEWIIGNPGSPNIFGTKII